MDASDEFEDLLAIDNKYPLEELIIHPRVQKDYYKNTPRLETFGEALEHSKTPVCYNVFTHQTTEQGGPYVYPALAGREIIR